MNSRDKGKRGEREFRDVLLEAGYCKAHRGQQYHGGTDSPDVNCPELPEIHWEVKRTEKSKPLDWLIQAAADCRGKKPVVAWKRNNCHWIAILPMSDFLEILRRSDLPQ
jgi:Holliday junction resolvase